MKDNGWHEKIRVAQVEKYKKLGFDVESSHKGKKVSLFRNGLHNDNFLSDADILVLKNNKVVKIIEIQQSLRPKEIIGIIKATDMCNRCKLSEDKLSNVELTIAIKKQKKGSKKPLQIGLIKTNLKVDGCLSKFDFEEVE